METTIRLVTARDLAALPDDEFRYELLRGELIQMPPPRRKHGIRLLKVGRFFLDYAERHGGEATGESGYQLEVDPDTVLAPGIAYIRPERVPAADEDGYTRVAPDVALEINSPSSRAGKRREKVRAYHAAGTRIVIFLDESKKRLTIEHADGRTELLRAGDAFDGGDVMPGFRVAVKEFFR